MRFAFAVVLLLSLMLASCCPTRPAPRQCARQRACPSCRGTDGTRPVPARLRPVAKDMVRVAAGVFLRGSRPGVGLDDERPQRKTWLSTFDIDRLEVTVADYRRCVKAGKCAAPSCTDATQKPESRPRHPVVCIPWEQARRYCAWASKRLPTESEWEKAARSTDGRLYPWGNAKPSCKVANYSGCHKPSSPHAVGSLPKGASKYGALDMAGNVWEWVADWHHEHYYTTSPRKNPPGPWSGVKKVVRGGAFSYGADELKTHGRTFDLPTKAYNHVGIRCARSVN